MAEEFSHTVIHRKPLGVVGQQRLPPKQPVKPAPGWLLSTMLQFEMLEILSVFHVFDISKKLNFIHV